eukprot:gene6843-8728_t
MLALVPGPNNFCALNNGIRRGVGVALLWPYGITRKVHDEISLKLRGR